MDKLCDKKLIDRSRCESDRRVVFVKITKKGLDLLERINMADFHSYMDRLTDEEAELLNKLLDKLR